VQHRVITAAAIAALATGAGCDARVPIDAYTVEVSVRSDTGAPLPGIAIRAHDTLLGETGPLGGLRVELTAPEGTHLRLAAECPETHRPAPETVLRLRHFAGIDAANNLLRVSFECRPRQRHAAVVVRAAGHAGLPVLLHGQKVARTNEAGNAHLLVALDPGESLRLALDTSAHPRLRPHDPTAAFTLGDADEVFVFEYNPVLEPLPRVRRPRRPPPPPSELIKIESPTRRPGAPRR
jgi:hypothetical protein